jgi:HK97 family phage prohead protease
MHTKSCPVQIKAVGDGTEDGTFEAIVSAFGNVDTYGDRVMPGAFTDTLAEWEAKGAPIPVLWSHMSQDPDYHIGYVEKAEERPEGLWVQARLDLEGPKAQQVYRLLKGKRVTQFSFAYDVIDGAEVKADGGNGNSVYELRKLKLYEVGPTLIGVNQETELLAVKAARRALVDYESDVKAGRVLSAKNETALRAAYDAIGGVLATLSDDGKAKVSEPANDEDPHGGKSEEPTRDTPARSLVPGRERLELLAFELAMPN